METFLGWDMARGLYVPGRRNSKSVMMILRKQLERKGTSVLMRRAWGRPGRYEPGRWEVWVLTLWGVKKGSKRRVWF